MRYQEIKLVEEIQLDEIDMSPSSLKRLAAATGAQAGMEFEMIVPGVLDPDIDSQDNFESEPDYDYDESVSDIDDIIEFFGRDMNSRRTLSDLRDSLYESFREWAEDKFQDEWNDRAPEMVRDFLTYNATDREIVDILGLSGGEAEEVLENHPTKEDYNAAAEKIIEDNDEDYINQARQVHLDDFMNDTDNESEWLGDAGLHSMSSVQNEYSNIDWPYWTEYDGPAPGDGDTVDQVADDFGNAIGRPVNAASGYHSARREAGTYVVEPDGSLDADPGDYGLEFVSPPLPLAEMLSDLDKVKAWAQNRGCYTGKSYNTGLHINVSVPGYSLEKLDYTKLALLLGDKYVLEQYGRLTNTYCKSALGKVQDKVKANPEAAKALLDKMRSGMDQLASKAIHSGSTDKYTSINTKSGYIEFRSPGGDWLDENFDKIENTLLRFTVALSAAIDPEAYRQEYLKKLYKLLEPTAVETKNPDTVKYFSDYVAGKTPRAALRSFVKQAQLERKIKKDPTGGQKYWWRVGLKSNPNYQIEVVGSSAAEAIDAAMDANDELMRYNRNTDFTTRPVRPYSDAPVKAGVGEPQAIGQRSGPTVGGRPSNPEGNYVITPEDDRSSVYYRFNAAGIDDANVVRRQWVQDHPERVWIVQRDDNRTLGQPPVPGSTVDLQRRRVQAAQGSAQYSVFSPTGRVYNNYNTEAEARTAAQRIANDNNAMVNIGIGGLRIASIQPQAATSDIINPLYQSVPIPGVTDVELDIPVAPPRPLGAGRELIPGMWNVLIDGQHVFRVPGATQGEANQAARQWILGRSAEFLRDHQGGEVEVVPAWREA